MATKQELEHLVSALEEDIENLQAQLDETEAPPLPEAGGVAWVNVFAPNGLKVNITARGHSTREALDDLRETLAYAFDGLGYTPFVKVDNIPQPPITTEWPTTHADIDNGATPPPPQEGATRILIEGWEIGFKGDGEPYIQVKGGPFSKYGVRAWKEVVEPMWPEFAEAAKPGMSGQKFNTVTHAVVEEWQTDEGKTRRKVVAFE